MTLTPEVEELAMLKELCGIPTEGVSVTLPKRMGGGGIERIIPGFNSFL